VGRYELAREHLTAYSSTLIGLVADKHAIWADAKGAICSAAVPAVETKLNRSVLAITAALN
jgi:hypothetical protein